MCLQELETLVDTSYAPPCADHHPCPLCSIIINPATAPPDTTNPSPPKKTYAGRPRPAGVGPAGSHSCHRTQHTLPRRPHHGHRQAQGVRGRECVCDKKEGADEGALARCSGVGHATAPPGGDRRTPHPTQSTPRTQPCTRTFDPVTRHPTRHHVPASRAASQLPVVPPPTCCCSLGTWSHLTARNWVTPPPPAAAPCA